MFPIRARLPFVRVAVWRPRSFRAARPALVSDQGSRRCQMRLRSSTVDSDQRFERSRAASSSRRESRWCWSTVFQVRDGSAATARVKVR